MLIFGHYFQVTVKLSQEDRTRAMRTRLMEATIDSLVELGWSGTTTTVVSQRAGVSRGAQLHHFPTKQALVVAAVEHLMLMRREELAAIAESEQRTTREILEILSQLFVSPVFFAALELWVAARSDAELREHVLPLERRVGRDTHSLALRLLKVDDSRGSNRQLIQITLDLMRGLALAASLSDDSARRKEVLDSWAVVLETQLEKS